MSASQLDPAALPEPEPEPEHPGWRTWVSTTGRWWAIREGALTSRQLAAGCVRQLHAATREGLSRRISDQDALSVIAAADAAEWPPGWRGGRVLS